MKNKIFMYLFLFALLLIIYQYMNEKKIFESQDKKIELLKLKNNKAEDSIASLQTTIDDLNYFTLQGNDNAMSYLESQGYEARDVEDLVANFIYDQNLAKGNNPIIPFEGINGTMKINKIKFLNHKWILADFTDGMYWGEMIIEYYINKDKSLELNSIASLLYPNN